MALFLTLCLTPVNKHNIRACFLASQQTLTREKQENLVFSENVYASRQIMVKQR